MDRQLDPQPAQAAVMKLPVIDETTTPPISSSTSSSTTAGHASSSTSEAPASSEATHSEEGAMSLVPNVTRTAIEAAIAELELREEAAAIGQEDLGEEDDGVIARNVTPEQLDEIPDEWLRGLKVRLRSDGALVAVQLSSEQHGRGHAEMVGQVREYARANGLQVADAARTALGRGGVAMPDIKLLTTSADGTEEGVAIALFEIEVDHRSGPEMIVTAAEYLTDIVSVACVVYIKFYHPRQPHHRQFDELRVPAAVLVFRRGNGRVQVAGRSLTRVRLTQSQSFGNEEIDPARLMSFMAAHAHALLENPFDNQLNRPNHLFRPSPLYPDPLDTRRLFPSLHQALTAARAREQEGGNDVPFTIPIQKHLPAIQLDLVGLLDLAIRGWSMDQRFYRDRQLATAGARTGLGGGGATEAGDVTVAGTVGGDAVGEDPPQ